MILCTCYVLVIHIGVPLCFDKVWPMGQIVYIKIDFFRMFVSSTCLYCMYVLFCSHQILTMGQVGWNQPARGVFRRWLESQMRPPWSVADPGIDRQGGRRFFEDFYTPQLALICSRGVRGIVLDHISVEIWSFFVFGTLNGGGGGVLRRLRTPSGSAFADAADNFF